jgi:hypothetical protein
VEIGVSTYSGATVLIPGSGVLETEKFVIGDCHNPFLEIDKEFREGIGSYMVLIRKQAIMTYGELAWRGDGFRGFSLELLRMAIRC